MSCPGTDCRSVISATDRRSDVRGPADNPVIMQPPEATRCMWLQRSSSLRLRLVQPELVCQPPLFTKLVSDLRDQVTQSCNGSNCQAQDALWQPEERAIGEASVSADGSSLIDDIAITATIVPSETLARRCIGSSIVMPQAAGLIDDGYYLSARLPNGYSGVTYARSVTQDNGGGSLSPVTALRRRERCDGRPRPGWRRRRRR